MFLYHFQKLARSKYSRYCGILFFVLTFQSCLFPCFLAVPLSEDHKPNKKDERKRIEDAGGIVVSDGKHF